jgi:prepilin-type N-terminal cleavage/methylation domain-containing protein
MNKPYNLQPITYNLKPTSGFTLIELLVVVSIIFLITSVFISNAQEARAKARDVAKIEQARQVKTALAVFKNDRGATPGSLNTALKGTFAEGSTQFNNAMSTIGFSTPPKSEDRSLVYYDDGTHSTLLTTLESDEAKDKYGRCITSEGEYDCTYDPETGKIVLLDSNGEIATFNKETNENEDPDDPNDGGRYTYNEPDDGDGDEDESDPYNINASPNQFINLEPGKIYTVTYYNDVFYGVQGVSGSSMETYFVNQGDPSSELFLSGFFCSGSGYAEPGGTESCADPYETYYISVTNIDPVNGVAEVSGNAL